MGSDAVTEFMEGALVTWVRTFENDGGRTLTYAALADGVFLHDVVTHLSPQGEMGDDVTRPLNRCPEDSHARLANLSSLVTLLRMFYQEFLGQIVLSPLPDVVKVSRKPETPASVRELRQVLLLTLGCAVQSPLKEDVIAKIKSLPLETQHDIVQCIQEVTDNAEAVWPSEWIQLDAVPEDQADRAFCLLVHHCRRLATERDQYYEEFLKTLLGEGESDEAHQSVHHLGVQLAELKGQLRRLRQEHDEKAEKASELKEELEQTKAMVSKLRQENVDLIQDARAARAWRDEADILRERASRVDTLEAEVLRYRDKLSDIEFYKTRVEELREDNRILSETKEMLEDQLASSRRRAEQVLDLENSILQLKQTINHMNVERDADQEKIQQLLEENAQLQLSAKNSLSESANLVAQMDALKCKSAYMNGGNIGTDLIGDAQTRILKLELENQRLEAELGNLKAESLHISTEKILELEKENKRLSIKVNQLQEVSQKGKSQMLETLQEVNLKQKENERLQDTINTIKTNSERQATELQKENSQLQELLENLRERQKKTTDDRLNLVEKENKELTDVNLQLQNQVSRLEYEKHQLQKLTERLRESAEKLSEVEHQKAEIERENRDLHKAISAFKESCERYEKLEVDHASLQMEFHCVTKTLENTKETIAKLEAVQSEKMQLQAEVQRLQRSLETLKNTSSRIGDLEAERDQLLQHVNQLQQQVAAMRGDRTKNEQLELQLLASSTEVQRLQRSYNSCQKKLQEVEKEKVDVETENTKLQRTVETLKVQTKKLNELEKDLTDMEGTNDRLDRENKSLTKEVSRLKGAIEVKDNLVDEATSKVSTLERENKKLSKQAEDLRSKDARVRELEQEKRELEQQVQVERKTLATLREDLVAEKVKTQQFSNQLERLTSDLTKLGLNPENLNAPLPDAENERYKVLEAMLEDTLKRSVEIREEKIASLESRLSESVSRNQLLRSQLLQVRSEYESLLQRHQEEGEGLNHDVSLQIFKMQENIQRLNEEKAGLENEVSALTSQTASYREQVCALQSQVTSLSNQNTVMSKHNAKLQSENARLQVENTTLQSQSASLIAQNSALQTSVSEVEGSKEKAQRVLDEKASRLNQLVSDHEALQRLHQQLSQEYETLTTEHSNIKTSNKTLRMESKLLQERQNNLSASEDELLKMREVLEEEMSKLKNDSVSLANLRAEHSRLKDDFRYLFSSNEKLRAEYKNLQGDYKTIKTENNTVKLRLTELGGELNEARDQLGILDVEVAKLTNKCQVLQSLNASLEEDRRSLMSQVSLLLTQYHDLLTQTLEDKQNFHQEEKNFMDKLNNLRRQKEKLEEKIMEQYRRMDSSPNKKKSFGSNLVRRVRKAGTELINKVPRTGRSRSRGRDSGESPDSSSLGSSQANDSLDSGSDTCRSSPHLPPSPPHDSGGETTSRRGSVSETLPLPHGQSRKSLPPAISDLYLGSSLRSSVSSEDVGSLKGEEHTEADDDTLSAVSVKSGAGELTRVGSRRPVYFNSETESVEDVEKESTSDAQTRSRPTVRSSCSSPAHTLTTRLGSVNEGTANSSLSTASPRPPSMGHWPGSPPCSSTPKVNGVLKDKQQTPRVPPRTDLTSNSAPKLPPRGLRPAPQQSNKPSHPSSQNSSNIDVEPLPAFDKLPPTFGAADIGQKGSGSKDQIDNSIWYEYGCV